MAIEILPIGTTGGEASLPGFINAGDFVTVQLTGGPVTTTAVVVQHETVSGTWRDLVEKAEVRQLDVENTAIRVRGPLSIRVQRRGTESCGCSASNWCGNGKI